jgi:hypothetical protein
MAPQNVQLESRSKEKIQHQVGLPLVEDFLEDSVEHVLDVIACHNLSPLSFTCPQIKFAPERLWMRQASGRA